MRSILTITVFAGFMTLSGAALACGNHDVSTSTTAPVPVADGTKAPMTKTQTGTATKTTKPSG